MAIRIIKATAETTTIVVVVVVVPGTTLTAKATVVAMPNIPKYLQ